MPKSNRCTICKADADDLVHLDLEVIGSEGIWACAECRRVLTSVAMVLERRQAAVFTRGWDAGRKTRAGDGPRKHRTLVRIDGLRKGRVAFALYGFRNFGRAVVELTDLPGKIREVIMTPGESCTGKRFHVWANLEAEREEDIGFENWQVGPEPGANNDPDTD